MVGFKWTTGGPLPTLDDHSVAKLRLYAQYLKSYFPTVVRRPATERLGITIVDGFCGGGKYRSSSGQTVDGSPFLLLDAVRMAEAEINKNRTKPFYIDARFHFVDQSADAIEHLRNELWNSGYGPSIGTNIHIHRSSFKEIYPTIKNEINSRTKRGVGRSIFILDQKGYSDAPLATVADIMESFSAAEVLLTFAVDHLLDRMWDDPSFLKGVAPIEIDRALLREMIDAKDGIGGRYAVQRLLKDHILIKSSAKFISPFFLRSSKSHKDMWVVHLSKHPTARNVMVDSHWNVSGYSRHPGRGGLDIVGFDPKFDTSTEMMFQDWERAKVQAELRRDLEAKIRTIAFDRELRVDALVASVANLTAARLIDIQEALKASDADGTISLYKKWVSGPKGKPRDVEFVTWRGQATLFL